MWTTKQTGQEPPQEGRKGRVHTAGSKVCFLPNPPSVPFCDWISQGALKIHLCFLLNASQVLKTHSLEKYWLHLRVHYLGKPNNVTDRGPNWSNLSHSVGKIVISLLGFLVSKEKVAFCWKLTLLQQPLLIWLSLLETQVHCVLYIYKLGGAHTQIIYACKTPWVLISTLFLKGS